jgi:hypothetical protein
MATRSQFTIAFGTLYLCPALLYQDDLEKVYPSAQNIIWSDMSMSKQKLVKFLS